MSELLVRPNGLHGKVHDITAQSARTAKSPRWSHVGFGLYRLAAGDVAAEATADREVILVLVEGRAAISADGQDLGELGERMTVFEALKPHCVYVPGGTEWVARATTDCTLAVCAAPAQGDYPVRVIQVPDLLSRGKGTNRRTIYPIAMEEADIAGSLLVTEVFTPAGHWSSYPPHRHDEDDFPAMTYLEETYYHRLDPAQGYGHQRVYTEDGRLDETMSVADHDVVLVPEGHHPCAAAYGYDMYYLNVMAGPLRKWRFRNDPAHDWIARRDA